MVYCVGMASDRERIRDLERQVSDLIRRTPTAGLGNPLVSTAFGSSFNRPYQVGFPAKLTSVYDATTGYAWSMRIMNPAAATVIDPGTPLTGDSAVDINNRIDLPIGTLVWMELDPAAGGYFFTVAAGVVGKPFVSNVCPIFETIYGTQTLSGITVEYTNPDGTKECVTNPVDCCPVVSTCTVCSGSNIANPLWVGYVSGCGTTMSCVPLKIDAWYNAISNSYEWRCCFGTAGCNGCDFTQSGLCAPAPSTVYVNNFRMYCSAGSFLVDLELATPEGGAAFHTGLAVTISACEPFCATVTVPADSVCGSDTILRISADPAATCGGGSCTRTRTALGTGSTSATVTAGGFVTLTIPAVTVPAGSILKVDAAAACLALAGAECHVTSITFAGAALINIGTMDNTGDTPVYLFSGVRATVVGSTTTGDVVITATSTAAVNALVALLGTVTAYTGGSCAMVRWTPPDGFGTASNADTGSVATTASATAPQALMAAMAYFDTTPPADGAPGGGFTGGQEVSLAVGGFAGTVALRELYQIITANGTFDASTPETHDQWVALGIGI